MTFSEFIRRADELKQAGVYEKELLVAYRSHQGDVLGAGALHGLFRDANRARLRACGAPIPAGGWPRPIYRGTLSPNSRRNLSWTASLFVARFFALRPAPDGAQRQVWRTLVDETSVYCCLPLANEYLVDADEVQLLEQGTSVIAGALIRDGLDAAALKIASDARREQTMDPTIRRLALQMGLLRDTDTSDVLHHLGALLGAVRNP